VVADIFQRYQNNKSNHPTDFFLKRLAYQLPLENSGGKLSNSKTAAKILNTTPRKFSYRLSDN
jgi:hypothetical protein